MISCFVQFASIGRRKAHNSDGESARQPQRQRRHTAARCAPSSLPFVGEWIGQSASFGKRGEVLPVPETYVPREYADWGIEIRDWATVSSMKVSGEQTPELLLLTKFMLPTVGCEADAASFVDDKKVYIAGETASADDVEVSNGPPSGRLVLSSTKQHFIGHPRQLPTSGKAVLDFSVLLNSNSRCQIRINLNKWSETAAWAVQKIDLFQDQYSGEYTGGRELPMSCGAEAGFSKKGVPKEQAQQAIAAASHSQECLGSAWCGEASDDVTLLHLPLGTSLRLEVSEDLVDVEVVVLPGACQEPGEKQGEEIGGPVLARVVYKSSSLVESGIEQLPERLQPPPSSTEAARKCAEVPLQ